MQNKRILMIAVSSILVVATFIGVMFAVKYKNRNLPDNPPELTTDQGSETNGDIHFGHTTDGSVIEFEDGNEIFLDTSLVAYLERMEFGVPAVDDEGNYYFDSDGDIVYDTSQEKDLEAVLDNLIMLINHFAKEEYSMEASHQIQRFYVRYYERLTDYSYTELVEKLTICFRAGGADAEILNESVINTFGINSSDECMFVFSPMQVAEIKVEFFNVLPASVIIGDELERLCIYDSWRNEEDDGYERNLEGWLHNVIKVADEAGLSEEKIIVAQILYAGSLANAEYRADWSDALIRCMTVEDWSYDGFKLAVEAEFGVCIDYNVPLIEYFDRITEV